MNDFVKKHKCTYILEKVKRESDVKSYRNDSSDEAEVNWKIKFQFIHPKNWNLVLQNIS